MAVEKESVKKRSSGARSDLGREYRPIGIGAVAAALTVTGAKTASENRRESEPAGNSNERELHWNSIAA